jgi:hypothetical protein
VASCCLRTFSRCSTAAETSTTFSGRNTHVESSIYAKMRINHLLTASPLPSSAHCHGPHTHSCRWKAGKAMHTYKQLQLRQSNFWRIRDLEVLDCGSTSKTKVQATQDLYGEPRLCEPKMLNAPVWLVRSTSNLKQTLCQPTASMKPRSKSPSLVGVNGGRQYVGRGCSGDNFMYYF